jgi:hypothetical protein
MLVLMHISLQVIDQSDSEAYKVPIGVKPPAKTAAEA